MNTENTTETTEIVTGSMVSFKGGEYEVADIKSGWYHLVPMDEADGPAKARFKDLELLSGPENVEDEEADHTMAGTIQKYKNRYEPCVAYSGTKSLNNGDDLAHLLEGLSPGQTMEVAERVLLLDVGFLSTKYGRLNPGQQRMNAGNRLRAALKRGDASVDEVREAILEVAPAEEESEG